MIKGTTATIAILLSAMSAGSALAADKAPDWWMVYDNNATDQAQFVDIASVQKTPRGTQATMLTVDLAGNQEQHALTLDCEKADRNSSLRAFVCGSETYRMKSGLNIRDFPPAALTKIYFQTKGEKG